MQVLGTICEELPPDGVLFIYLSASGYMFCHILLFFGEVLLEKYRLLCLLTIQIASGRVGHTISSPSGTGISMNATENVVRNFPSHTMYSDATSTSPFSSPSNSPRRSKGDCLHFGTRGNGGIFLEHYDQIPLLLDLKISDIHVIS